MTRLVGVRAVCDVCSAARAVVFCVVHRHVACAKCDAESHRGANSNHQRVDLAGAVTALPFCDKCDNAPATSYCESESVTLCNDCDVAVHANKSCASHHRRLISKALAQRNVSFIGTSPTATSNTDNDETADPSSSKEAINQSEPSPPISSITQRLSPPTTSAPQRPSPPPPKPKPKPNVSPPIKPRIRNPSSPMKRRSRRDEPPISGSTGNEGARVRGARSRQTPVRLSPAPMPNTGAVSQFREPSIATHPMVNAPPPLGVPMTPDNALAYMQAMSGVNNRDPVDYFANAMANSQYFMPPEMLAATFQPAPSPQPPTHTPDFMQVDNTARNVPVAAHASSVNPQSVRRPQQPFTTIAPLSIAPPLATLAPRPAPTVDPMAMAAAAATAAGELYLLSASDVQGSGSSDQMTPPFGVQPETSNLAVAVTAAAANAADQYFVQQARRRGTNTSMPQAPLTGSPQIGSVAEEFAMTDFEIPRGADDFAVFGTLDLSSFEPPPNFNDDNAPLDNDAEHKT